MGAHVLPARAYSPTASGAIQGITGGFWLWAGRATQGVQSTIRGRLLIEQDGDFYISDVSVSVTSDEADSGFAPLDASELGATDFSHVTLGGINPTSHPDFSATAADVHFGFAVDLSWTGPLPPNPFFADFLVRSFRIDQLAVSVAIVDPPSAVPASGETGVLLLLAALGLAGAAFARPRRPLTGH